MEPTLLLPALPALVLVTFIGAATASFVCVLLERRAAGRSWRVTLFEPSACICGHPIPLWRNVPVATWSLQRGRAACCDAPIPRWYVLAEAGVGVMAGIGFTVAGVAGGVVAGLAALCGLALWHRRR
jgi:leader peptidase (prepilin peptidase) / N-methyltransferase